MLKQFKQRQQGFTIIEVLIVLAIASLILLAVFLAVPALQRNSRNTQRKGDVGSVLAGFNDYVSNNNGALPLAVTCTSNPYKFVNGGTCAAPTGGNASEFKMSYYTAAPALAAGAQAALATDTVRVVTGAKCNTTNDGSTLAGGARQVAVQYMYEPNGTLTATCTES